SDTESRETVGEKILHGGRSRIHPKPSGVGSPECAELHGEECLVAAVAKRPSHQSFVVPCSVVVACVEKGDAAVNCGVNGCDALLLVGWSVHAGHSHATKSERKHGWAIRAQLTITGPHRRHHHRPPKATRSARQETVATSIPERPAAPFRSG